MIRIECGSCENTTIESFRNSPGSIRLSFSAEGNFLNMPQIRVFQCPACGANLSYDGGPETSFACQFCGTSVIVPEELSSRMPGVAPMAPDTPGFSQQSGEELPGNIEAGIKKVLADVESLGRDNVDDPEILELLQLEVSELINKDIQTAGGARAAQLPELLRLAGSGKKPEAANLFRQAFPTMSASEAELAANILGGGSLGDVRQRTLKRTNG